MSLIFISFVKMIFLKLQDKTSTSTMCPNGESVCWSSINSYSDVMRREITGITTAHLIWYGETECGDYLVKAWLTVKAVECRAVY